MKMTLRKMAIATSTTPGTAIKGGDGIMYNCQ